MKLSFNHIVDTERGKTAIIVGLGPSLRSDIEKITHISKTKRDKYVIISCNRISKVSDMHVDYWVLANNLGSMTINNNFETYNKMKNCTIVYASTVDPTPLNQVNRVLKNNFLPFDQRNHETNNTIQTILQRYTNHDVHYGSGTTVAVHMTALAILLGCKDIYITGVDLDYSDGYVNNNIKPFTPTGAYHRIY
jgi:hypothetical protein